LPQIFLPRAMSLGTNKRFHAQPTPGEKTPLL
jgi:hypothetical protein